MGKDKDNLFPRFETYREQIDKKYWFPTYSRAVDTLNFQTGPQKIRQIVKYQNYKQFGANNQLIFGDAVDDNSKPIAPATDNKAPAIGRKIIHETIHEPRSSTHAAVGPCRIVPDCRLQPWRDFSRTIPPPCCTGTHAADGPAILSLSREWSEDDGVFVRQPAVQRNHVSICHSEFTEGLEAGRVYMGVGPEQNFTYIAALKPAMA